MTLLNSGIYKIINIHDGKFYIGSAVNLDARFLKHRWELENNRHGNKYLQAAYIKYGSINFEFHIVERCSKETLIEREQLYIDTLKPLYNLTPKAGSNLGVKYTEESKKKMSAWQIGRKMSEEAKAKMSAKAKGNKRALGYKHTDEALLKMSNWSKNRTHKEETKIKIGLSALGNKSNTGKNYLKNIREILNLADVIVIWKY